MLINNMPEGSRVHLEFSIGVNTLEFETEVVRGITEPTNGVFVQPILKDDKMINFSIKGIMCKATIVHKEENIPYRWINVKVRSARERDGSRYHAVLSADDVKKLNRRQNYRVWLGVDAIAKIGTDQATHDVTVKDISSGGISFICKKSVQVHEGNLAHLSFFDDMTGTNFSVTGIVKRSEEVDDLHMLYGCMLNATSPLIDRFVIQKQREQARRKNERPRRADAAKRTREEDEYE